MLIERRRIIRVSAAFFGCSCPASKVYPQLNSETLEAPIEDFGCTTIDNFSTSLEITDFSPTQEQRLDAAKFTDYGTFIFSQRWKNSDGLTPNQGKITLGCHSLNGNSHQQQKVVNFANDWLDGKLGELNDLKFNVPIEEPQIRIRMGGNRNNSYVGRDNLAVSMSEATMNLANFNREGTVKHEFGHALGVRHEHRFPGAIEFKEDVVVSEMRAKYGWSTAQAYRNILTPVKEYSTCVGDPNLNEESIMMYTIPSHWTVDGKSFSRKGIIAERDRACLIGVYSA